MKIPTLAFSDWQAKDFLLGSGWMGTHLNEKMDTTVSIFSTIGSRLSARASATAAHPKIGSKPLLEVASGQTQARLEPWIPTSGSWKSVMVIQFSRSTNPHTYLMETNMQHNLRRSSKPNFKHPWSTEHESSWIIHHIHLIRTLFWSLPAMLTRSCQALVETSHLETSLQLITPLSTLRKMTLGCFQPPWHQQWIAGDSGNDMNFTDRNWKSKFSSDFHPTNTISVLPKHCNSRSWRFIKGPYKNSDGFFHCYKGLGRPKTTPSTWLTEARTKLIDGNLGGVHCFTEIWWSDDLTSTTPEAHAMPRIQDQA